MLATDAAEDGVVGAILLILLPARLCDFAFVTPDRRPLPEPSLQASLHDGDPEASASFSMAVIHLSMLDMGSRKTSGSLSCTTTGSSAERLEGGISAFFGRRGGSEDVEVVEDRRRSTMARVFDICLLRLFEASARNAGSSDAEGRFGVAVRVESLLSAVEGGGGISM